MRIIPVKPATSSVFEKETSAFRMNRPTNHRTAADHAVPKNALAQTMMSEVGTHWLFVPAPSLADMSPVSIYPFTADAA